MYGAGALYQVTIAGRGLRETGDWKSLSFLEACMRAYLDGSAEPMLLSSGLEDYFLGTYYFNKGRYANNLAGLTYLNIKARAFSAYRFHDADPLFFRSGLRLSCRCGETEDGSKSGKMKGDPPETEYSTYTWVYQWPDLRVGLDLSRRICLSIVHFGRNLFRRSSETSMGSEGFAFLSFSVCCSARPACSVPTSDSRSSAKSSLIWLYASLVSPFTELLGLSQCARWVRLQGLSRDDPPDDMAVGADLHSPCWRRKGRTVLVPPLRRTLPLQVGRQKEMPFGKWRRADWPAGALDAMPPAIQLDDQTILEFAFFGPFHVDNRDGLADTSAWDGNSSSSWIACQQTAVPLILVVSIDRRILQRFVHSRPRRVRRSTDASAAFLPDFAMPGSLPSTDQANRRRRLPSAFAPDCRSGMALSRGPTESSVSRRTHPCHRVWRSRPASNGRGR